jgi:hypothetical protein
MNESLKSARVTYLALLAVCATVLLFAFSPSKVAQYEAAIGELNLLAGIDHSALHEAADQAVNEALKHFDFRTVFHQVIDNYAYGLAHPGMGMTKSAKSPWQHCDLCHPSPTGPFCSVCAMPTLFSPGSA